MVHVLGSFLSSGLRLASAGLVLGVASVSTALAAEPMVSTDAESLYALTDDVTTSDLTPEDFKEFVGCFVSQMDLPQQVYIDCALSVVSTTQACRGDVMTPQCLSAAFNTAQKCALPVKDTIDGARECLAAQQD
jgi:hypothetical protein